MPVRIREYFQANEKLSSNSGQNEWA